MSALSMGERRYKQRETAAPTNLARQTVNTDKVSRRRLVQTAFTFSSEVGAEGSWGVPPELVAPGWLP